MDVNDPAQGAYWNPLSAGPFVNSYGQDLDTQTVARLLREYAQSHLQSKRRTAVRAA